MIITTKQEYDAAMAELHSIFDVGSPENRYNELVSAIIDAEKRMLPELMGEIPE